MYLLLSALGALTSMGQKPLIDSSIFGKWPHIENQSISLSNDGKYAIYTLSTAGDRSVTIKAIDRSWEYVIPHSTSAAFSDDNQFALSLKAGDTLMILTLGTSELTLIPKVQSFKLVHLNQETFLSYIRQMPVRELVIRNLTSGSEKIYDSVANLYLSPDASRIVYSKNISQNNNRSQSLREVIFPFNESLEIWSGEKVDRLAFSETGEIAFIGQINNETNRSRGIWLYIANVKGAEKLVDDQSMVIGDYSIAADRIFFSQNGKNIFFSVTTAIKPSVIEKQKMTNPVIWTYKDEYLQTEQEVTNFQNRFRQNYQAVFNRSNAKVMVLENERKFISAGLTNNRYVLSWTKSGPECNYYQNISCPILSVLSLVDATEKTVIPNLNLLDKYQLSPKEKYVVWFDPKKLTYYSFEISTGITRDIAHKTGTMLIDKNALQRGRHESFGVASWLANDTAVLIYDSYDIWMIDPRDKRDPVNITNGFGRKNEIVFSICDAELKNRGYKNIFLSGFNARNKNNGFWECSLNSLSDPIKYTMGPYVYFIQRVNQVSGVDYPSGVRPLSTKNKDGYLLMRMGATEAPNLFFTKDWKSFQQVSDINPQRKYNWLTSELAEWKNNGDLMQGLLYKPENFDPKKKYPLIFNYYEKRSDLLNEFIEPTFSGHNIDIPFYVSNGYLVFVPDMHFQQGHNGKGALNSIESAVKYLSKFPWVDHSKLGIQGHSFGGWQTNYLITHTNLFKAACEAAGVADQISAYDQVGTGIGASRQKFYETLSQGSPYGIGVTPWSKTSLYVENSPVLYVNKISTPLLIMHGKEDESVPFVQAIEMFLAMKRAGKKVWLLQYNGAGHVLYGTDMIDYTIRMKQFFDHYLKDAPPPIWMTEGIPAKYKGIKTGYELDLSGKKP